MVCKILPIVEDCWSVRMDFPCQLIVSNRLFPIAQLMIADAKLQIGDKAVTVGEDKGAGSVVPGEWKKLPAAIIRSTTKECTERNNRYRIKASDIISLP